MKSDIVKLILVLIVGGFMGLFLAKQCSDDPSQALLEQAISQNIKIANEQAEIKKYLVQLADSIKNTRQNIINRYNYEITKIDSVYAFGNDSTVVNAILRYWTDRLYRLPGFFEATSNDFGTSVNQ